MATAEVRSRVPDVEEEREAARWSRAAALGLLLAGLGPLIMLTAALAWRMDVASELPFFLGTGAIGLVGALLVWRFGAWAKIVGILAALLIGVALFWTAFALASPTSIFDFVPGVLVIPGALFAIVCCVAALVAGRRGHRTPSAVGGERTAIRVALGVVAAAVVVSGIATATAKTTVDAAGADATVVVKDFKFVPAEKTLTSGATLHVRNDDPFLHTFTIDALGIDVALTPGSEALVTVEGAPGTYVFYCEPHVHGDNRENPTDDDMAGWLTLN